VVIFLMLLVLLPQMFCAFQLERAWRTGAAEYGVLGSHYVDSFRRKWAMRASAYPRVASGDSVRGNRGPRD